MSVSFIHLSWNNLSPAAVCVYFPRKICHGDGCHPGRLSGAAGACREDGRPLRACRSAQEDVEAGGGGAAAGAGGRMRYRARGAFKGVTAGENS